MSAKQTAKPAPRGFDRELAEMEALSEALKSGVVPGAAVIEQLRKGLAHRNNFLVAKAARLVADAELFALLPDVLAAYDLSLIHISSRPSSRSIAPNTKRCARPTPRRASRSSPLRSLANGALPSSGARKTCPPRSSPACACSTTFPLQRCVNSLTGRRSSIPGS